jgi:hypothetical protein
MIRSILSRAVFSLFVVCAFGQAAAPAPSRIKVSAGRVAASLKLCSDCIRAHEEFLASDALNGRGSATHDELLAATYIAAELRAYGIEPAGDAGGYLQRVALVRRKLSAPPQLQVMTPGDGTPVAFKHGLEVLFLHVGESEQQGPLQKIEVGAQPRPEIQKGAFVLLKAKDNKVPELGSGCFPTHCNLPTPAATMRKTSRPSPC